ncbi:MAG: molybdopterin-dependent oxidoreductase [Gemmatimonadaceae bacterium]
MSTMPRRALIATGVTAAVAAAGGALAALGRRFGLVPPDAGGLYGPGETLSYAAHRVLARHSMAREFSRATISAKPFANAISPLSDEFKQHEAANFANWRLDIQGLIERPASLSIADLRRREVRSQITEVSCEEGWSYVAEWTGTPLATVLNECGVRANARYIVYFSSDPEWWESIDIDEALHPQTLLAWQMNGADLPVPFGGPLRLRVPRQLGYKSVKFVNRIVVTDSLAGFGTGNGQSAVNDGYAWYAGI